MEKFQRGFFSQIVFVINWIFCCVLIKHSVWLNDLTTIHLYILQLVPFVVFQHPLLTGWPQHKPFPSTSSSSWNGISTPLLLGEVNNLVIFVLLLCFDVFLTTTKYRLYRVVTRLVWCQHPLFWGTRHEPSSVEVQHVLRVKPLSMLRCCEELIKDRTAACLYVSRTTMFFWSILTV